MSNVYVAPALQMSRTAHTPAASAVLKPAPGDTLSALWHELGKFKPRLYRSARELATFGDLSECRAAIERLPHLCRPSHGSAGAIAQALAGAAAALARAGEETHESKERLAPGLMVEMFEHVGALLGLLASVAVCAWVPLWGGSDATMLMLAKIAAVGVFLAGGLAQIWATGRASAYQRADRFLRHLSTVRVAMLRAEASLTLESLSFGLSCEAQHFYAALLAWTPSADGAHGPAGRSDAPAVTCLNAASDKSSLCTVLLGIRAGVISLPDEQARDVLRGLLEAEARAAGAAEFTMANARTGASPSFKELHPHLVFRQSTATVQWSGPVCQHRLVLDSAFDAFLCEQLRACSMLGTVPRLESDRPEGLQHA